MYQQEVDRLTPGLVVAADVLDEVGRPLLRRGTVLTDAYIRSLLARGIRAVHIADGMADDVPRKDIVSVPLRSAAARHLSTVFAGVAMAGRVDEDDRPSDVDDVVRRLGSQPLMLDAPTAESVSDLFETVDQLLNEVLDAHTEAGLETLRNHSDYSYQHSVDVAAVGALLGHRAGLSRLELRELALGCLLHDIGMIYIDTAIIDKPGRLSPAEHEDVERHPYLGFELVRRMPLASIYPAHVAYQHHERQDGSGYPRGLKGSNRIIRTTAEQFDRDRMLLLAEIAAVADVYSALTSDRPYRPAMGHDVAHDILASMAGRHLNGELVGLFQRTFPRYPVGHWVVVSEGPWAGHRGVVLAVPAGRPDRPVVRLHLDDRGEQLRDAVEVSTLDEPDLHLALCPSPLATPTLVG